MRRAIFGTLAAAVVAGGLTVGIAGTAQAGVLDLDLPFVPDPVIVLPDIPLPPDPPCGPGNTFIYVNNICIKLS